MWDVRTINTVKVGGGSAADKARTGFSCPPRFSSEDQLRDDALLPQDDAHVANCNREIDGSVVLAGSNTDPKASDCVNYLIRSCYLASQSARVSEGR
jgi:hypothetical protein